jgi:hypothetical protein
MVVLVMLEVVYSKAASQTTPVSGSFTVPASATSGSTQMRVSMKYNAVPTECEAFSYGSKKITPNLIAPTAEYQQLNCTFKFNGIRTLLQQIYLECIIR